MSWYWTSEEDALIVARELTDEQIAAQLGRTLSSIRQRRWKVESGRARADYTPKGRPPNQLDDVWKYVARGEDDECWLYTGARRRRGYGAFSLRHRTIPAHRAAFHAATGIDPGALMVCHSCDNPPCCNPAHLFLGTATDNVHDMLAKDRGRWRQQVA